MHGCLYYACNITDIPTTDQQAECGCAISISWATASTFPAGFPGSRERILHFPGILSLGFDVVSGVFEVFLDLAAVFVVADFE